MQALSLLTPFIRIAPKRKSVLSCINAIVFGALHSNFLVIDAAARLNARPLINGQTNSFIVVQYRPTTRSESPSNALGNS
jgi:hypothetical protein